MDREGVRKHYTPTFKAQIASTHGVHPNLIGEWKAIALKGLPALFEKGQLELEKERAAHEKQLTELYAEIGRLTTPVAWLKKKTGINDE